MLLAGVGKIMLSVVTTTLPLLLLLECGISPKPLVWESWIVSSFTIVCLCCPHCSMAYFLFLFNFYCKLLSSYLLGLHVFPIFPLSKINIFFFVFWNLRTLNSFRFWKTLGCGILSWTTFHSNNLFWNHLAKMLTKTTA